MNIDEAFEKYTKHKDHKDGSYSIDCVKGNFGVHAPTKATALNEARHYFVQYFSDGEYNE